MEGVEKKMVSGTLLDAQENQVLLTSTDKTDTDQERPREAGPLILVCHVSCCVIAVRDVEWCVSAGEGGVGHVLHEDASRPGYPHGTGPRQAQETGTTHTEAEAQGQRHIDRLVLCLIGVVCWLVLCVGG